MVKKIALISLLLIAGCGKNVSISTKELESNSALSDGNAQATPQEGIIKRGITDQIIVNNSYYKVSIYSSYLALEFIAIRPLNTQTPVRFRGKIKNNEMILEYVVAK
ncbi:MAG: hypothetical protein H0V66_03900 [Bdellovibrionales bacterium]|nr:hypothetical protein [Bdellovibrionales bacterium]